MEAPGAPGQEGMVCGTELICVHTASWATVTMAWSGRPLFCPEREPLLSPGMMTLSRGGRLGHSFSPGLHQLRTNPRKEI